MCRATNECGVGDYYTMGIGVYDNLYLTLSPNPATDAVTLQLTETDEVKRIKRALDREKRLRNPALERYDDAALVPDR